MKGRDVVVVRQARIIAQARVAAGFQYKDVPSSLGQPSGQGAPARARTDDDMVAIEIQDGGGHGGQNVFK